MSTKITKQSVIEFQVDSFGLYTIEIVARCDKKNDLKVEIDDIQFREIPPTKNIESYNIPPSWNGTNLKGLSKTIFFILTLNKGKHTLKFTPKGNAVIEGWGYSLLSNTHTINFENLPKAEDRDKQPLCSFILVNTPLKSVTADVSVSWHRFDGDDVKLIIDNKIEQNTKSRFWKNWVWHSQPLQLFTGTKRETKTFITNLDSNTHYIEFWVDKTPTLHKLTLNLGNYTPKRIPTVEDPEWTGDFYDDTNQILLARLILGESENQPREAKIWIAGSVLNRKKAIAWPNTIHEVILQDAQYDPFKTDDPNFKKIINPLSDTGTIRNNEWKESYEVAVDILSGKVENPTEATHFHGIGVTRDWFLDNMVPDGYYIKNIGDVYFYWSPN